MRINFRVITLWGGTGEVREQYFSSYGDAATITDYLNLARENSCNVSYVLQEFEGDGYLSTLESAGDVGKWVNLPWPREDA